MLRAERQNFAALTPRYAQALMHGIDTPKNASDNHATRSMRSASVPANTLTTASAIIQVFGLTSCRLAAPHNPRRGPLAARAGSMASAGALKICQASQVSQAIPIHDMKVCTC